jgi:cytosine/adenosine deaminase-related metal-dependent hydrolase
MGTVVHAADRSDVDTVMVAGRLRKLDGKLLNMLGISGRVRLVTIPFIPSSSKYLNLADMPARQARHSRRGAIENPC